MKHESLAPVYQLSSERQDSMSELNPSAAAASATAAALQGFPWAANSYFGANSSFNSATAGSYGTDFASCQFANWGPTDSRFPMSRFGVHGASSSYNPFVASAISAVGPMRNGRRRRNLFTPAQVNELKKAFEQETYVKPEHRERLAKITGLTPQQVKIWFQNNRYKCKQKQKEEDRVRDRHSESMTGEGSPSSSGNDLSITTHSSPEMKHVPMLENPLPAQPEESVADVKNILQPYQAELNDYNSLTANMTNMYASYPGYPFVNMNYAAGQAYQYFPSS